MGYVFEWDTRKAKLNARKHGVTFDEATSVFGDPQAMLLSDPDHSLDEIGTFSSGYRRDTDSWWSPSSSGLPRPVSSPHDGRHGTSGCSMKKKASRKRRTPDRNTLRADYDFAGAVRGATAARYRQGTNVVVIDPDVLDVFPDSAAVNDALRALAAVVRQRRRLRTKRRSA